MFSNKVLSILISSTLLGAFFSMGCSSPPDTTPVSSMQVQVAAKNKDGSATYGPAIVRVQGLLGPSHDLLDVSTTVDLDGNGKAFITVPFGKTYTISDLSIKDLKSITLQIADSAPIGGKIVDPSDLYLANVAFDFANPSPSPQLAEYIMKKTLSEVTKKFSFNDSKTEDLRGNKAAGVDRAATSTPKSTGGRQAAI